jgi:acyl-CoA thioester hydrolase
VTEPRSAIAFPFRHAVQVSLRDLDALAHVNHAVYLSYLEVARTNYYFGLRGFRTVEQLDFILGSVSCRYRSPALLHETLIVSLGPSHVGTKSWDLRYEVHEESSGRHILDAATTQVQFDYAAGRAVEIPAALRALLERDRIGGNSGEK